MAITVNKKNKFSTNVRKKHKNNKLLNVTLATAWRLSPAITASIIKQFFFQPNKYKLSQKENDYKKTALAFETVVRNKKIRGWKWGNGPAILLVHGWNSAGLQLYKFIDPLLERGFSVITYDKPAHGISEGTHTSYFEFTDVVRHLLNHPVLNNIKGIIGHSMGASAVINAISKENVKPRLVLFAPALPIKEMLYETITGFGIPESILTQLLLQYELEYSYSIDHDNPIALIPQIKTDALIIHDKNDNATPYSYSVKAAEMNSKIHLYSTNGLGHGRVIFDDHLIQKSISFLEK